MTDVDSSKQTDKEKACAAVVTARGEPWFIGPTVNGASGKVYRGDIAIPGRGLVVEVRSSDEARKLNPERVEAFRAAGWRTILVHSPEELAQALKSEQGLTLTEQLIADFRGYLKTRLWMTPDQYATVATFAAMCALAKLGTFKEVPYLDIRGPSGTGKSRLGELLRGLTGGKISGGTTVAATYRWLKQHPGATYIMDEGGAVLRGKQKEAFKGMLLSGHRRDGKVTIADPRSTKKVINYPTFGPKVTISIRGVDMSAIARRMITINMGKAPVSRKEFLKFERSASQEQYVRRQIKQWASLNAELVREFTQAYLDADEFAPGQKFTMDEQRDLWAPMLATAAALGLHLIPACAAWAQAFSDRAQLKLHDALDALVPTLPDGVHYLKDIRERLQERHGDRADHWNERSISLMLTNSMGKRLTKDTNRGTYLVVGRARWRPARRKAKRKSRR